MINKKQRIAILCGTILSTNMIHESVKASSKVITGINRKNQKNPHYSKRNKSYLNSVKSL